MNIMIISDDEGVSHSIATTMHCRGHDNQFVVDPTCDDRSLARCIRDTDLIIIDLDMPGNRARRLLDYLHREFPLTRYAVTTTGEKFFAAPSFASRACGYIPKPFMLTHVWKVLDRVCEEIKAVPFN